MSKKAMKLALEEFKNQKAGLEEVGITDHSLDELIKALEEALAKQEQDNFPVNWAAMLHYPDCWDTAAYPELRDAIHEALAWSGCSVCKQEQDGSLINEGTKPKQEQGEPVAMQMDVIVVNLVREGINKHRARELAEHFIKTATPQLKQEQGEPVGTAGELFTNTALERLDFRPSTKIYTTPQQRTWVELTDEQINQAYADSYKGIPLHEGIVAKFKEKNT